MNWYFSSGASVDRIHWRIHSYVLAKTKKEAREKAVDQVRSHEEFVGYYDGDICRPITKRPYKDAKSIVIDAQRIIDESLVPSKYKMQQLFQ